MRICELNGKRIAIWGFGQEGQSTLKVLTQRLTNTKLTVLNDNSFTPAELDVLAGYPDVDAVSLPDNPASLSSYEVVVKSPGISPYRPDVVQAKRSGTQFTSATNLWFAERQGGKTLCITGTKGKSTTASVCAAVLRASGIDTILAGNIGVPLLDTLDMDPPAVWVAEISSYQAADLTGAPDIAVLLNLCVDHLDWHGTQEQYVQDKLNLFGNMTGGISVLNRDDPETARLDRTWVNPVYFNDTQGFHYDSSGIYCGAERIMEADALPLRGAHNLSNICAALTAATRLGADVQHFNRALEHFSPLPHRLMTVATRNGVQYVDDSISTVPESTMAALRTFGGAPVTLLVGGMDRGLDYTALASFLVAHGVERVIAMPDTGSRIAEAIRATAAGDAPEILEVASLEAAVLQAKAVTPAGGVVLLSPAAASYGRFSNYAARGKAFLDAIRTCD